jgi:hypothetical protein
VGSSSSGSRQQAAGSRQQAAGSRQQAAGSRQQAAGSRQQAAGSRSKTLTVADLVQIWLHTTSGSGCGMPRAVHLQVLRDLSAVQATVSTMEY